MDYQRLNKGKKRPKGGDMGIEEGGREGEVLGGVGVCMGWS